MIALNNILVATDFGDAADAALIYGRALAQTFGATLHVLHVKENAFMRPTAADPQTLDEAALKHVNERLTADDRLEIHARALVEISDSPSEAIVEYARRNDIDLIVTGTHGRSGLSHMLVGSVAEHVMRTAPCPVLTVRPKHEFMQSDDGSLMMTLKNILVATDFGDKAGAALAHGRALAGRLGATLHVLHVPQNISVNAFVRESYLATEANLQQDVENDAREQLNGLLIGTDESDPATIPIVVTGSSVVSTILEYARDHAIDLVVMGTHGRRGLAHLLMDSVAEQVVRVARCPVLTVHHPDHWFVRPDPPTAVRPRVSPVF